MNSVPGKNNGNSDALVTKAQGTVSDLSALVGELNAYTEQLRSLLEQMEATERDD